MAPSGLRTRDVLFASAAGFISWGLLVGWFPLLRFIGYAFVAGITVTLIALLALALITARAATRPAYGHGSQSQSASMVGMGGHRAAFLRPNRWKSETRAIRKSHIYRAEPLYPQSFVVSETLDEILGFALRDFVGSWYGHISKSPVFVNEVDRAIRVALANIRDRLLGEDLVEFAVSRIVPLITAHLSEFDRAERAIRGKMLDRNVTESEELDLALARKFRDGRLHPAVPLNFSDPKQVQQEYLKKIVVRLLPRVLPESLIKSRGVSVLIKEIFACAVLYPVMQMLSDPDTWNQILEAIGRTALQDRKTVKQLRAALDEHASPGQQLPKLGPNDSERSFERWVRAIRRCNNLSDARRFRSHVVSQLKRETMIEGRDPTYIRRLETGKRVLDQKVAKLSASKGETRSVSFHPDATTEPPAKPHDAPLTSVLHSATGLSYFMEYMDRQHMMPLVQFWIVVDGFRNPLEDDFGEDASSPTMQWSQTDRTDVAQINEAYLTKAELNVPETSRKAVREFLEAGRQATPLQYRQARSAILMAQTAVLEEMQSKYYPKFKKSDLYYKYLTSDASTSVVPPLPPPQRPAKPDRRFTSKAAPTTKPRPQAPAMIRAMSQPNTKATDLRRAAVSATDVRTTTKLFDDSSSQRGSFDSDRSAPLFDDDYDTDPLANSTWSIGKDSLNGDQDAAREEQVIETMEAALNEIITKEPKNDELASSRQSLFSDIPISLESSSLERDSSRGSLDFPRIESLTGDKTKPSIASLGLVNTSSRIGVFSDDDLFPDEEKFIEDEYADPELTDGKDIDEQIHEAAPGDLGLVEAIAALTSDIERLVAQEAVVDTLTRKAELTNNAAELRILGKSKSSLQREIRRKEMQKQQYIVQESDNSLYGRSTIQIKSIMVGKEEDGREFALYLIEVQRKAGDQMVAASWAVARRYSEFHDLHQRLRMHHPSVRNLEFPRRRMVMKLQKEFLHKRRVALENYLRQLLLLPDVCRSRDLRSFLSQQAIIPPSSSVDNDSNSKDIVSRIYNSVTDGMDDFLGNIAVLDQLSVAGQNLISAATSQLSTFNNPGIASSSTSAVGVTSDDPTTIAEAEAELAAYDNTNPTIGTVPTAVTNTDLPEPFVKPICDIFLELFELNKGNNWLRGRAVVVVLHQLLGGTIERKVRDAARAFATPDSILRNLQSVRDNIWPSGGRMRAPVVRSRAEKAASRTEAAVMLATLVPDLAGGVVGRANAQAAARRVAAVVANQRLNAHLAFTLLDEILGLLFGVEEERLGVRRGR